ncbi:ABC transporter ATP-binding protein [Corynebacterium macclintockiae]|uniref:ABC transporter ATP-binding protein n=1 Tax=Corynebacterium macclintockiae TaxID=2913501 RepID=UPI002549E7C2|nr:ABC transporter ATP-binding protein [Corynebacterium macclintockiae]MDK8891046.1 ABC transporter ATP-binding protein [Corynebacterium macclintockiae]
MEQPAKVPSATALQVTDLSFSHGAAQILSGVSLPGIDAGTVTALVGPNGAGKSTLLRCMAQLCRFSGSVTGPDAVYLPQDPPPESTLTVFESVLLALQHSRTGFSGLRVATSTQDRVSAVLTRLGLNEFESRTMSQLSGGQRQLVSFAQAIVRRPRALLLDEPTSALDLRNQLTLMEHICTYAVEAPAAVVVTMHDLSHAARFADRIAVLHNGTVYAHGSVEDVLTEEMLREVYRVDGTITPTGDGNVAITTSRAI